MEKTDQNKRDSIIKAIINGLQGKNTHLLPKKAIEGLDSTTAKQKLGKDTHSSWELLHHLVVWQEGILQAIEGKNVDWKDIDKNHNWPTDEYLKEEINFSNLVHKFEKGLSKAENLVKTVDLYKSMPAWNNEPVIQAYMVLLQHNSYHLGQIVAVRKALGIWTS